MKTPVDARDLPCPQPVILTREALKKTTNGVVSVLVNSTASVENVRRFAESQNCTVTIHQTADGTRLDITRSGEPVIPTAEAPAPTCSSNDTRPDRVMFIQSDSIGPDPELGQKLMAGFLSTMTQMSDNELPSRLFFVNQGVYVTCTWNDTVTALKQLEKRNVQIFSCGTCLEHFGLMDQLQVGQVGNAFDSVQALLNGERIINLG